MGNCMETCGNRLMQRKEMHEETKQENEKREGESLKISGNIVKETSLLRSEKGGLRVKIVLTKEELEWLIVQINNKGGKSLEDFLGEIERGRRDHKVGLSSSYSWKPSLESIMECPEIVQEMNR